MEEIFNYNKLEYKMIPDNYEVKSDGTFKIIIMGNRNVGIGEFRNWIPKNKSNSNSNSIGFDFYSFIIKISGKKLFRFQIWDTCGEEGYRSLVQNFFGNTSLVFVVYAINE